MSDDGTRMAADHDPLFADWDANTERLISIMSAHLPVALGTLLDATCRTGMACDAVCKVTALFSTSGQRQISYTPQVEDTEGTRTHTRNLQAVSELELRAVMEASGFQVRRSGKMLGRVVLSGIAV